jgi:hypothetical protein
MNIVIIVGGVFLLFIFAAIGVIACLPSSMVTQLLHNIDKHRATREGSTRRI